jgi:hypothetical protein
MRSSICGAVGLAAIGLLALAPVGASAQQAEFKLLGNNLWNRHSDVLLKQGQPTRIEVGAALGGTQQGGGGGGMMGGPGMGSGGMMPGGMMMGPGGGPPGGSPYGGGGKMGAMMSGGGGSPYGAGGGGGLPGLPGGMGGGQDLGLGGPGGGPAMGGGAAGGAGASDTEGEITWIYERPGGRTDIFLFNKDGRLIQVSSFGYSGPAITRQGVKLGDPMSKVYVKYGWTANIVKDATRNTMTLDYSKDHHIAFQLADRGKGSKVVGMTVGITELSQLQMFAPGTDFGNARKMGGSMGGMMGAGGGMMGAPGGMGGGMQLPPPPGFGGAPAGGGKRGGKFGGMTAP